ncbi:fibronectin type III domain-containing protein [Ihubacter sp. mB4P-1]|uniref:fibronectin type III domain-containing protein n=1 Tax=Ihubacter sp. mB4P-1 TaxID=3242370 RepID=UPI00217356CB|nr:fibronectin type III domain-containing protein [Emergencia sp.]
MKKLITLLITLTMVLTMAVPAFAAEMTAKIAKPAKVQELNVFKNGYQSLKVSWKPVAGATGYEVYRSTTGKSGSFTLKKTTTSTSYTNTGITCGKTYYYKVRAVNKAGKGSFSAVKNNRVQPSKASITKVRCIDEWEVRVYWDKVAGASGYQVYRSKKGADNWKLYKTVSSKYTYATNYLEGDTKYSKWEWKVRAYRTVNGKKVYGYFSTPKEYVPDWTIDEIYEELWKYGESLAWTEYEFKEGTDNPETGNELWPTDRKYHFKHYIGWNAKADVNGDYSVYTNPENGATHKDSGFEAATPDNSSWDVAWPERISYYDTKTSILKRLKPMIKDELYSSHYSNPLYWDPYLTYDGEIFGGYNGVDGFSLYIEKDRNSYKIWSLW